MISLRKIAVSLMLASLMLVGLVTRKTEATETADFQSVLAAAKRSPDIPESEDLYGWLEGSWEMEPIGSTATRIGGEIHVGWVLEGRAVQDVWIWPRRAERQGPIDKKINTYGTTLRLWDPAIKAWRITFLNPFTGQHSDLVGRKSGEDIVQVGTDSTGTVVRWCFVEIKQDSFRWTGETLEPDGRTWKMSGDFRGKRMR